MVSDGTLPVIAHSSVYWTNMFAVISAEDSFHDIMPSIDGWHTFTAQPASLDWIGENLRRALLSARYVRLPPNQWDQPRYDQAKAGSSAAFDEFLMRVGAEFQIRRTDKVLSKALILHVWWQKDLQRGVKVLTTKRISGGWRALANDPKQAHKMRDLSIEASNKEIGIAVREMLAISTFYGKLPPFAAWPSSGG